MKVGQNVVIPGVIVSVDNRRDDPAFDTVTVKCNDGRALTVSVMNVTGAKPAAVEVVEKVKPAKTAPVAAETTSPAPSQQPSKSAKGKGE